VAFRGGDDYDDDDDGLPLKSWYSPGAMMKAMAINLLTVRKI